MFKRKGKGFTLVELLAVIVILAVILVIAIPQITKVIKQTRVNAMQSTAKLIVSKAEEKEVENEALEVTETMTCSDLVKLDDNYDSANCTITKNAQDKWEVSISGASGKKFEGITCTGTKDNMTCTDGSNNNSNNNNNTPAEPTGNYIVTTTSMYIGQAMPSTLEPEGTALRSTPSAAINDWKLITGDDSTRPFYIKHTIENKTGWYADWDTDRGNFYASESACLDDYNDSCVSQNVNIITETYIEFVVTEEMASANEGMVSGTYTLRGGVDESSTEAKTIFNANMEVIKTAFDYANHSDRCYGDPISGFDCIVGGLHAIADWYGRVYAYDNDSDGHYCNVSGSGISDCG